MADCGLVKKIWAKINQKGKSLFNMSFLNNNHSTWVTIVENK